MNNERICNVIETIDGERVHCDRVAVVKGYCWKHYTRARQHGHPDVRLTGSNVGLPTADCPKGARKQCSETGCNEDSFARGYCRKHYARGYYLGQFR